MTIGYDINDLKWKVVDDANMAIFRVGGRYNDNWENTVEQHMTQVVGL